MISVLKYVCCIQYYIFKHQYRPQCSTKQRVLPLKVTVLLVSILSTGSTTGGKILDETYMKLKRKQ